MSSARSSATVRLDLGVVDVAVRRSLRTRTERIALEPGTAPQAALASVLATSALLRPGSSLTLRVILETSRVVYVPARDSAPRVAAGLRETAGCGVELTAELREGLARALGRRWVNGPATLELGPLVRADVARAARPLSTDGRGVVVDRSDAAVTVLVIGASGLVWARSVPAADPGLAVRLLIDRARGLLGPGGRLSWWGLSDVASQGDAAAQRRHAREFEAAAAAELDGVPSLQEARV
jgi:hypothetical protein